MKKAFASDFDNTLYHKGIFHQEDLLAIKEYKKMGNLFGICTGRSLNGVLVPSKDKVEYDFYIVSTGSLILNSKKEVIYSKPIDNNEVKRISELFSNYSIAYNSGYDFISLDDKYEIVKVIRSLNELPKDIYGISFQVESEDKASELCIFLNKNFNVSAFNNNRFIDITSFNSSKGTAIKNLKELLNIDQIIGMGDSYNDITLLDNVDTSYTFLSSPEKVKEHANYIKNSLSEALKEEIRKQTII